MWNHTATSGGKGRRSSPLLPNYYMSKMLFQEIIDINTLYRPINRTCKWGYGLWRKVPNVRNNSGVFCKEVPICELYFHKAHSCNCPLLINFWTSRSPVAIFTEFRACIQATMRSKQLTWQQSSKWVWFPKCPLQRLTPTKTTITSLLARVDSGHCIKGDKERLKSVD